MSVKLVITCTNNNTFNWELNSIDYNSLTDMLHKIKFIYYIEIKIIYIKFL